MKENLINKLLEQMKLCEKCTNLKRKNNKDCSLINIFENHDFCTKIPSIWTDWFNRVNSDIIIVGQDWGPYKDMEKLNQLYIKNENIDNWKKLIEQEKSNTKKRLTYFIKESSHGRLQNLDTIFITNAIMCARKGDTYRGDNIDLKKSTINCSNYLLEQIEIVKPKVILTLGYYPLYSLSNIYKFEIEKNLKDTIKKYPIIFKNNFVIIPLYHPVAQITNEEQLKQYSKIWEYVK